MEINAGNSYTMTVELMNVIGWSGVNSGHPGVVYNVIDENNFDYVYFRPHSQAGCYQTGYMLNGQLAGRASSSCPNGSPSGGVWFTVRVEVRSDKSVNIFLNNDPVTSLTAHFDTKGRGGVLACNGYKNIFQFKKFCVASN
ncbi:putative skeletal organic matrix protein 7 [Oculina patagonica]